MHWGIICDVIFRHNNNNKRQHLCAENVISSLPHKEKCSGMKTPEKETLHDALRRQQGRPSFTEKTSLKLRIEWLMCDPPVNLGDSIS